MKNLPIFPLFFVTFCLILSSCNNDDFNKDTNIIKDNSNYKNSVEFTEYAQILNLRHALLIRGKYDPIQYSQAIRECAFSGDDYMSCLKRENSYFLVIHKLDKRMDELSAIVNDLFPKYRDMDMYQRYELLQSFDNAITPDEALANFKIKY